MSSRITSNMFGSSFNNETSSNGLTIQKANSIYINETGDTMNGDLNMNNHQITNLANPVNDGDAVNKQYFESNKSITTKDPLNEMDAVNKRYFESNKNIITENLNLGNNKIIFNNGSDLKSIDVPGEFSGLQINGELNISNNNSTLLNIANESIFCNNRKITGVQNPTADNHAANKSYVDLKTHNLNNQKLFLDNDKHTYIVYRDFNSKDVIHTKSDEIMFTYDGGYLMHLMDDKIVVSNNTSDKIISGVKTPENNNECANKSYVDTTIKQEIEKHNLLRFHEYKYIKEQYNPKFWVSAFYHDGIKIKENSPPNSTNSALIDLSGEGFLNNGNIILQNASFRFDGTNNIISNFEFTTDLTFILIAKADSNSRGRLFTSSNDNILFGYWLDRKGSLWMNSDVKLNGTSLNDGNKHTYVLTMLNNVKNVWEDNVQYVTNSTNGAASWNGSVVLGNPISVNENGLGNIYECLCFDRVLNYTEINSVTRILGKYII